VKNCLLYSGGETLELRTPEKFTDDLLTRFAGVALNDISQLVERETGFDNGIVRSGQRHEAT